MSNQARQPQDSCLLMDGEFGDELWPENSLVPSKAKGRQSISFSETSAYDDREPALGPEGTPIREYNFSYTTQWRHMVICTADEEKTPVFFAEMSEFTRHKADVLLHVISPNYKRSAEAVAGKEKSILSVDEGIAAPVVAVAHFPLPSRDVKIGVGDPKENGGADMVWEEMKNTKLLLHSEYQFELNTAVGRCGTAGISFSNDLPRKTRRRYTWQRTRSPEDGVEGGRLARGLKLDNYKLTVEGNTGEPSKTIAVFLTNRSKSLKYKGKLRVYESGEVWQQLEAVALLTAAVIHEKSRRRRTHHGAAGGVALARLVTRISE